MKAVVWQGVGDIRLDEVDDPRVQEPADAVIRIREDGWLKTVLDVA